MSSSGSMSRAYNMYELSNGILGLGELDTEDEQSKSDYLNAM
jgi:hypothetical protein